MAGLQCRVAEQARKMPRRPNKSKKNCLDLFGFGWIYLVESGLFKGLQPKK
jgi:hypothetical protein